MGVLSQLKDSILTAFFPRRCPLCGTLLMSGGDNISICPDCSDNITYIIPPICHHCGRPVLQCGCLDENVCFERCVSPFIYSKSVRSGIHRLKFYKGLSSARFFAEHMASVVQREYSDYTIDIVTCVPMYSGDLRKRGYNQAALLAKHTARILRLPVCNSIIDKPYRNKIQHSLSRGDRRANVCGAFRIVSADEISGKAVLLCDDIITTGSTLDECAKVLLEAGASRVLCVTAASAIGFDSQKNTRDL